MHRTHEFRFSVAVAVACSLNACLDPVSSTPTTPTDPVRIHDTLRLVDTTHVRAVVDSTVYTVPNSRILDLTAKANGEKYRLLVHLPNRYSAGTATRFPVVYLTDGAWDFALLTSIYYDQSADGTVPDYILVAISWPGADPDYDALRTFDFSPATDPAANGLPTGGADKFRQAIQDDIVPFVDSAFRTNSVRVLGGSSLGGMFTLFSLLSSPRFFQGYIAISPAALWGNGYVPALEKAYRASHDSLPVALYMTGAALEFPQYPAFLGTTLKLDTTLRSRNYAGFRYGFRVLDETSHSGSKPEGFARGLQFVFANL